MAKIGHIIHNYKPMLGGGEIYVSQLIGCLSEHEHVVFQKDTGDKSREVRNVTLCRKPFRSFRKGLQVQYCRELLRQRILISHDLANLLPLFASRTIAVCHGVTWDNPHRERSNHHHLKKARHAYGKALAVVANDTSFYREMGVPLRFGDAFFSEVEKNRWLIPNCVDNDFFKPGSPIPAIRNMNPILVPRRVAPERGIELAIRMFGLIGRELPDTTLLIAGDTGIREYMEVVLRSIEEHRLVGRVFFTGRIGREQMPAFYRSALLTLVPTAYAEGTSLSALEAMSCGCPTFSTSVGGLADLPTVKVPSEPDEGAEVILKSVARLRETGLGQMEAVRRDFNVQKWSDAWKKVVERCLLPR